MKLLAFRISRVVVLCFLFIGASNALAVDIVNNFEDQDLWVFIQNQYASPTVEDVVSLSCDESIDDLTGIEQLVDLYFLNISTNPGSPDRNSVTDLSPLSELGALTDLHADGNLITVVPSLTGLSLLGLSQNPVTSLNLNGWTNLTTLHIGGTGIEDLSFLSDVTGLNYLSLWGLTLPPSSSHLV